MQNHFCVCNKWRVTVSCRRSSAGVWPTGRRTGLMCISWAGTPTCCLTSDGPVPQEPCHRTPAPTDRLHWTLTDSSSPGARRKHEEKKLEEVWWIIVLLQQWDLGLLRKAFGRRLKTNKAWIFRHTQRMSRLKSLEKNNAFWRLDRALLLLSALKCDCCHWFFTRLPPRSERRETWQTTASAALRVQSYCNRPATVSFFTL